MRDFRRMIISFVEGLLVVYIICAAVAGGWYGWKVREAAAYIARSSYPQLHGATIEALAPIVGALIGFALSAVSAAPILLLVDISETTRNILQEVLRGSGGAQSVSSPQRLPGAPD